MDNENNLEKNIFENINNENKMDNPSKKSKKLNIISIILIIAIFVGLGIYMIHVDGLDNIITLLKSVDYRWVFARSWNFNFMVDL